MINIKALYRAYIKVCIEKKEHELRIRAKFLAEEMCRIMREDENEHRKSHSMAGKAIGFIPKP